jgi:hypothetical protein
MIWSSRPGTDRPILLSGASSAASLVTPIVERERENHGFKFEETLKTKLQGSGASIPKTLQFKTYLFDETRLSINSLAVVHRRLDS